MVARWKDWDEYFKYKVTAPPVWNWGGDNDPKATEQPLVTWSRGPNTTPHDKLWSLNKLGFVKVDYLSIAGKQGYIVQRTISNDTYYCGKVAAPLKDLIDEIIPKCREDAEFLFGGHPKSFALLMSEAVQWDYEPSSDTLSLYTYRWSSSSYRFVNEWSVKQQRNEFTYNKIKELVDDIQSDVEK